ncbi:MAG TPA: hypothetical protein VH164_15245, partial [Ktedonobacteraceae bacterium]|nr:hypothetical protein [Ktedonobacteraceae bacterium]
IAFALLCWLIVPIMLSFILSQGTTRLFSSRYLVTIVPPLCLLVGLGVAALRLRIVKIGVAIALIALAARYTPLYYNSAQVENWNTATSWLTQKYQPGDGLVCYTNARAAKSLWNTIYPDISQRRASIPIHQALFPGRMMVLSIQQQVMMRLSTLLL